MSRDDAGAFDPTTNGEYLRTRFSERIWDSELSDTLEQLPEALAEKIVDNLVTGLLIEVGAQ